MDAHEFSLRNILLALLLAVPAAGCMSMPAVPVSEEGGHELYNRGFYQQALAVWEKAAEKGDAGAAYRLAEEYLDAKVVSGAGKVVERNMARAVELLQEAAAAGEARAFGELGTLYDAGQGVVRDLKKAAEYYQRAADAGMMAAQYNIGVMYERGEGVARDPVKAYYYYSLASDGGFFPFATTALAALKGKLTDSQIAKAEAMLKSMRDKEFP